MSEALPGVVDSEQVTDRELERRRYITFDNCLCKVVRRVGDRNTDAASDGAYRNRAGATSFTGRDHASDTAIEAEHLEIDIRQLQLLRECASELIAEDVSAPDEGASEQLSEERLSTSASLSWAAVMRPFRTRRSPSRGRSTKSGSIVAGDASILRSSPQPLLLVIGCRKHWGSPPLEVT